MSKNLDEFLKDNAPDVPQPKDPEAQKAALLKKVLEEEQENLQLNKRDEVEVLASRSEAQKEYEREFNWKIAIPVMGAVAVLLLVFSFLRSVQQIDNGKLQREIEQSAAVKQQRTLEEFMIESYAVVYPSNDLELEAESEQDNSVDFAEDDWFYQDI